MRSSLFTVLSLSTLAVQQSFCQLSDRLEEEYNEELTLRNLPDGKLLAHFDFSTQVKANTKPEAPCKALLSNKRIQFLTKLFFI